MDLSRFAIDTVTLAGPLEDKLRVIRDAGFGGVEIWAKDLVTHPGGVPGAVAAIRSSGLRVTSFQLLKDYEGLDAHLHEYKIDIAESLLDLMDAVGAKVLVVASSTSTYASGDMEKVVADLARWRCWRPVVMCASRSARRPGRNGSTSIRWCGKRCAAPTATISAF